MQEIYYPSSDGKTTIHACVWAAEEPKAVLQIVHGMAEYAERYAPFAEYMNGQGVTVVAEDHLGHGKSVAEGGELGYFADKKGYKPVLDDIRTLAVITKEKFPGLPYFIMGHSMGSFFTRKYIALYGRELAGAVIVGTGFVSPLVTAAGKLCARTVALFKGWRHRSKFLNSGSFGSYNKRFEKRTAFDWLNTDPAKVDEYIADPLCAYTFTCNGFYGLYSITAEACRKKTIKSVPDGLPIFIVSGEDDPVGGYGKGVVKLERLYEKYGKNSSAMLYRGSRHEVISDISAPQVYEDISEFINGNSRKD